ncbi:MAG: aldo/keto reductase [Aquabacterium sp.]|jgi:aryl-alcohol dehydrogenase-like predicted oxidoreductase|nr:MAG: aldo/keto reductase [Aquabacterium sp.]
MTTHAYLGRSGLSVSRICLGSMMFGGAADEAASVEIVAHAREAGVNFIDTADVYTGGQSEQIVGRAIAADRHRWVLASKVGMGQGREFNTAGLTRKWITHSVEGSLKRLGTDYLDIYYLHREDLHTPLQETVSAIGDLIRAGKIRHFGVSNFRGWRVAEVAAWCERLGVPKPVASQPLYNLVNRQAEVELLPACAHHGLGVVPYSPLARGVLTGKYAPGAQAAADTRAGRSDKRILETEWRPESLHIAREVAAHAQQRGISPADFAVAWILANRNISSVIAGPRTLAQWQGYLKALEVEWTAQDEAFADELVPAGHASTHGYTDPAYPVEGRLVG